MTSFLVVRGQDLDAPDGHAGRRPDAVRGRQPGVVDHRRRRRARRTSTIGRCSASSASASTGTPPTSTALRVLFARVLLRAPLVRSPFGLELARHPRGRAPHAGDRRRRSTAQAASSSTRSAPASPASPARCSTQTTQFVRHRLARVSALRRAADHAGARRHRLPLRRAGRRAVFMIAAGSAVRASAAVYWQFWLGAAAGGAGAVRARRPAGRAGSRSAGA